MTEPTQADRELAARLAIRERMGDAWAMKLRVGMADSDNMVQAFAACRIASTEAQQKRVEELEAENEKLKAIVKGWHYLAVGPDEMGDYYTHKELVKLSEPYGYQTLKEKP